MEINGITKNKILLGIRGTIFVILAAVFLNVTFEPNLVCDYFENTVRTDSF